MTIHPLRATVGALALATPLILGTAGPAGAQTGDLDCGDPGVGVNFPVDPANKPTAVATQA